MKIIHLVILLITCLLINIVGNENNSLGHIVNYMSFDQHRAVTKTVIESKFNYYPIIWISHSRTTNNKTNRLHGKVLSNVYFDYTFSLESFHNKDNILLIHERNL